MKSSVSLICFRGQVFSLTPEEYQEFIEHLSEWDD